MWTWTATYLAASSSEAGISDGRLSFVTFSVIAIGGVGAWIAGVLADRNGRTLIAGGSMAISGSCAVLSAVVFGMTPWIVVPVFLVWGVTVVSDSAQFSAMVTETVDSSQQGTALTLHTAIGFLLTLVAIRVVPVLADWWGWRWAFPALAIRPALGIVAMARLKASDYSARLAGGLG